MHDDLIERLGEQWRRQDIDVAALRRRLRRGRLLAAMLAAGEAIALFAALVAGFWFAALALREQEVILWLSAATLLVAVPAFTTASLLARRESLALEDETPRSLLKQGARRAQATLNAIRVGRWQLVFLTGFLCVLWLAQAIGLQDQIEFLIFYTIVVAAIVPATWAWLAWREARVRREQDTYARMIEQFEKVDRDASGGSEV